MKVIDTVPERAELDRLRGLSALHCPELNNPPQKENWTPPATTLAAGMPSTKTLALNRVVITLLVQPVPREQDAQPASAARCLCRRVPCQSHRVPVPSALAMAAGPSIFQIVPCYFTRGGGACVRGDGYGWDHWAKAWVSDALSHTREAGCRATKCSFEHYTFPKRCLL